jgi:hypothetical protein
MALSCEWKERREERGGMRGRSFDAREIASRSLTCILLALLLSFLTPFIYSLHAEGTSPAANDTATTSAATGKLPLYATFAVTIAFRGVVDVAIWSYNQRVTQLWKAWWRNDEEALAASKKECAASEDINRALRREVLIFSTTGIAAAIDRANTIPFSNIPPPSDAYPISLASAFAEPRNIHSVVTIRVRREDFAADLRSLVTHTVSAATNFAALSRSAHAAFSTGGAGCDASGTRPSILAHSSKSAISSVPFLDYAPQVFRYLRYGFGINETAYKRSIQGETEAMIEKFTEGGRSGSFFYFSEDSNYIVKTLTTTEGVFLVKWLPKYVEYMSEQRDSLLSRFVGFHAITLYNLTIHFIVMQSVFQSPLAIHERYDLKGSTIDRHAEKNGSTAGRRRQGFKKIVYKDNDLNRTVRLAENDRMAFVLQCKADAYFLRNSNIMDYSLLLGVHHTRHVVPIRANAPSAEDRARAQPSASAGAGGDTSNRASVSESGAPSYTTRSGENAPAASGVFQRDDGGMQASIMEGPGIYFFGIIDILQEYNTGKKLERYDERDRTCGCEESARVCLLSHHR